jgi:hypothetical protein
LVEGSLLLLFCLGILKGFQDYHITSFLTLHINVKDMGDLCERKKKHLVKVDAVIKFVALIQMDIEIYIFRLVVGEGEFYTAE